MVGSRNRGETLPDDGWKNRANCLTTDPDLFFPESETDKYREQIRRAKLICAMCDVAQRCLEYALITQQGTGIWGGLTTKERQKLKRP
jgi:WhiB family transcriptional regulator, redox-sensing transcriptional regulator